MDNKQYSFNSNFFESLALIFITLKLIGKINWSWLWVLSPIWGSFIIGGLVILVVKIIVKRSYSNKGYK